MNRWMKKSPHGYKRKLWENVRNMVGPQYPPETVSMFLKLPCPPMITEVHTEIAGKVVAVWHCTNLPGGCTLSSEGCAWPPGLLRRSLMQVQVNCSLCLVVYRGVLRCGEDAHVDVTDTNWKWLPVMTGRLSGVCKACVWFPQALEHLPEVPRNHFWSHLGCPLKPSVIRVGFCRCSDPWMLSLWLRRTHYTVVALWASFLTQKTVFVGMFHSVLVSIAAINSGDMLCS